jgi:hypothetical protein
VTWPSPRPVHGPPPVTLAVGGPCDRPSGTASSHACWLVPIPVPAETWVKIAFRLFLDGGERGPILHRIKGMSYYPFLHRFAVGSGVVAAGFGRAARWVPLLSLT